MSNLEDLSKSSGTSSPPEESENSGASSDKVARRPSIRCVRKRKMGGVAVQVSPEDNDDDDFVNPPSRAKKLVNPKASTKGGGKGKKRFWEDGCFEEC